jgi:hypothetical protein
MGGPSPPPSSRPRGAGASIFELRMKMLFTTSSHPLDNLDNMGGELLLLIDTMLPVHICLCKYKEMHSMLILNAPIVADPRFDVRC